MSSISDKIKKSSNQFSFISTFFDLVGNKEFKLAEVSTLYTTRETKETSLWRSLSAVAEQLGEVFYSNTLNFIDNVCNIDLCKVLQLQSLISAIGVNYTVFSDIKFMPIDVVNILDTVSIKREYLTSYLKVDKSTVDDFMMSNLISTDCMLSNTNNAVSSINSYRSDAICNYNNISDYWSGNVESATSIDDLQLDNCISSLFKTLLLEKIGKTYDNMLLTYLSDYLSDNILISSFELENDKKNEIESYKTLYNIPTSFDVEHEADRCENGKVDISTYNEYQLDLINIELNRRKQPFKKSELKTRYKYYKEKELKEYTLFILNEYSVITVKSRYLDSKQYELDNKYIELSSVDDTDKLFYKDNSGHITINYDMINIVSEQLGKITKTIRDIRESLKTQCQKNYMKGTKLFLTHIIKEYINNNIVQSLKTANFLSDDYVFDFETNKADVVEYIDPTQYLNICCDTDVLLSDSIQEDLPYLNKPYWKNSAGLDAIGPIDTTNIFAKLPALAALNFIFNDNAISTFYIDTLNSKFFDITRRPISLLENLHKFLETIYSLGAENTFISNDIFHTYDSYSAKNEYDLISAIHHDILLSVNDNFIYMPSTDAMSVITDIKTPLSSLLSILRDELANNIGKYEKVDVIIGEIDSISTVLSVANELTTTMCLSALDILLSDKYSNIDDIKYNAYQYALDTDSYLKQFEFDNLCTKMDVDYNNISVSFTNASVYIPENFKQDKLTLCTLISTLCISLSSIASSDERDHAVQCVLSLSNDVNAANEMSSEIELGLILETLSAKYDQEIAIKKNEIDLLRSSDIFKYRELMFRQYTGLSNGDTPYYYIPNRRHPSFMFHPFLNNYLEKIEYSYPIDNIVNIILENVTELIKENISTYIDEDGYLINMWKNPLNSNQDYMSRYEQSTHVGQSGKEVDLFNYDGLFYPPALCDFLNDKTYEFNLTANGYDPLVDESGHEYAIIECDFIEGIDEILVIETKSRVQRSICLNPWYSEFDLTVEDRASIKKRLATFKNIIRKIAYDEQTEIYKYGLDIYKNSYILLKTYTNPIESYDNIEKSKHGGTLWIRIHNHPIAFPAYALSSDEQTYLSESQVEKTTISNTEYNALAKYEFKNLIGSSIEPSGIYAPLIKDFAISLDKNLLIYNGQLQNADIIATYPILIDISLTYDKLNKKTIYCHNLINPANPIYSLIPLEKINGKDARLSEYNFETYFFNETRNGVIYSHLLSTECENDITATDIDVYVAYYDPILNVKVKSITKFIDSVSCKNIDLENVCIDVNDDIMTIAYLSDLAKDITYYNYLNNEINLPELCAIYAKDYKDYLSDDFIDAVVKTKQYRIGENSLILTDLLASGKSYLKYTDIGYFGLAGCTKDDVVINDFGDTYLGKYDLTERGIYKFLLMSKPVEYISNMIDFRYIVPIRKYEDTILDIALLSISTVTPAGTQFASLNYFYSHFLETKTTFVSNELSSYDVISSDSGVYSQQDFKRILSDYRPVIKIDESYFDEFKDIEDRYKYIDYPLLYLYSISSNNIPISEIGKNIPSVYINPYGIDNVKFEQENESLFRFSNIDDASFPFISATWSRYIDSNEKYLIQIDFNSIFNKSRGLNDCLSNNIMNKFNLFLNLEKTGDSGYLNVYQDPLNNDFSLLGTLYIKNISDDKPKFLLSTDINPNNSESTLSKEFILDGDNIGMIDVLYADGPIDMQIIPEALF